MSRHNEINNIAVNRIYLKKLKIIHSKENMYFVSTKSVKVSPLAILRLNVAMRNLKRAFFTSFKL